MADAGPFATLDDLAAHLRQRIAADKKKCTLIFAHNGTGKTRLSMAFKDQGKTRDADGTLPFRYVQLLSHGGYSLFEPAEMLPENKEIFRRILANFMTGYRFNPALFLQPAP